MWSLDGPAFAGAIADPIEAWLRCGPVGARHTVVGGRSVVDLTQNDDGTEVSEHRDELYAVAAGALARMVDEGRFRRLALSKYPDAFELEVKVAGGAKAAGVEKLIEGELARLAKSGPTDAEMKKLQNRASAKFVLSLQSNFARAQKLAEFEVFWGDAALLNGELDRYLTVRKEDVQRAVGKYLVPSRRSRVASRHINTAPMKIATTHVSTESQIIEAAQRAVAASCSACVP